MKRKLIFPLILILSLGTASLAYAADATTAASGTAGASSAATPEPEPVKETPKTTTTTTPKTTTTSTPKATPAAPKVETKVATVIGEESYNEEGQLLYSVIKGDNLWKIAKRYNTTYQKIAALNNITNPDLIFPSQVVAIPDMFKPEVVDAVASASPRESSDPAVIKANMGASGAWIHSILSDTEVPGLAVTGTFYDKDNTESKIYRKLALYAQDADHNVTAEFTLTVGNMYVTSPGFRIQNGTVIGDIYVNAPDFQLRGTTVEGNVYFETAEQMASIDFTDATVTGVTAVKNSVDAVAGVSMRESSDPVAIRANLSENGTWIHSVLSNVTLYNELVVAGTFHDKDNTESKLYRKLALYSQDENHIVTDNYTLTVPVISVYSPSFRIQNGTVVGDIHVYAEGFDLNNCVIDGNVYFATAELMASAVQTNATVTGAYGVLVAEVPVIEEPVVEEVDAVASATPRESSDPAVIKANLGVNGYWIHSILSDVEVPGLTVAGTFYSRDDQSAGLLRKLALYAQDSNRVVTANYTLTVGSMYVLTPSFRIQNGTVVGDIYVNADGFELNGTTVEGSVYFETQAQMDSAKVINDASVTGAYEVKNSVDATTGVSIRESSDPAVIQANLAEEGGAWIHSILSDVTIEGDLVVAGTFYRGDDTNAAVYRKLALYAQDSNRVVVDNYTLTVDSMIVTSPNFRIQGGTVVGDIYVDADGFELYDCIVDGNIYFTTQEQLESARAKANNPAHFDSVASVL